MSDIIKRRGRPKNQIEKVEEEIEANEEYIEPVEFEPLEEICEVGEPFLDD